MRQGGGGLRRRNNLPATESKLMMRYLTTAVLLIALVGCGRGEASGERPPRTFTISEGDTVTYKGGVARVGDKIVCVRDGRQLGGAVVPKLGTGIAGYGTGPAGSTDVAVSTSEDGTVVASCRRW